MRKVCVVSAMLLIPVILFSQDFAEQYNLFRDKSIEEYSAFRDECNRKYAEFLRGAWDWYIGMAPMPKPEEENPLPPQPYVPDEDKMLPVVVKPIDIKPVEDEPQPKPVAPIREVPRPAESYFEAEFYGQRCRVRMPESADVTLVNCSNGTVADGWQSLCNETMNNTIRDCLEVRLRYNLCDWAYLQFLNQLATQFCGNSNSATLLTAYLYCQSGYSMRLGEDDGRLVMLFASRHFIFDMPFFSLDGGKFYPLGETSRSIKICDAVFEGEAPMSLLIAEEQRLGDALSPERKITSWQYGENVALLRVPTALIDFFDSYPTSAIGGNALTRWAMYANTPLAEATKELLYPALSRMIVDCPTEAAAGRLLNWVQTSFVYEYDDKVWGHDRAFFAEETLYYPYSDCEDRSILYSRLVRDLLGLDVALLYYPGHLATAVRFESDVKGDAVEIDGIRFTVCDPTYIGAPIGKQMPMYANTSPEAILLKR